MTPEQLKASILQYAIQGKLVEQRAEEGTGGELYQQIKAEERKLLKSKMIKAEKQFEEIADNEKPFDIPENWTWVRFGQLGRYKKGPFGSALTKSIFVPKGQDTVKVYEQKNAIQKNATLGDYYITREYFERKMQGFEVFPGDILVSCAGTIGETYALPDNMEQGIINQALMRMKLFQPIYIPYFLIFFEVVLKKSAQSGSKGSAIKNIPPFNVLKNYCVPLPPLAEQKRIVVKIEELLPYVDHYAEAYEKLEQCNAKFPEDMKKSILQYAIQGKLVEQRPEEGTAEELYQQIRAEKQRLIREKKIKKEKPLAEISEEEIPFDIPESWKWCYIGELFLHNTGKAQNSTGSQNGTIRKFITTSNLYWDEFDFTKVKEMPFTDKELKRCIVQKGDLLVCEGGDCGRSAVWKYDEEVCIQNHVHRLRPYQPVDIYYFYYLFYLYKNTGKLRGKGVAIRGLSNEAIHRVIVPLPPLAEQKRIVAKIEELLPLCEQLKGGAKNERN